MLGLKYVEPEDISVEKNFREGHLSIEAQAARDAFLESKKLHPESKSLDKMTALEKRMQSGSI